MNYRTILTKIEDIKKQNEHLKKLIDKEGNISEKEIVDLFNQNELLIYLIPIVYSLTTKYNLRKGDEFKIQKDKEKSIKGQHRTDYTVVSEMKDGYNICLIEIEDASNNSIFKSSNNRKSPEWSNRFEHGYSQILDWLYSINYMSDHDIIDEFNLNTKDIKRISFSSILIIGKCTKNNKESRKLKWREEHISINNLSRENKTKVDDTKIFIVTLSSLYDAILTWIEECNI